jgi:hypothetical protein
MDYDTTVVIDRGGGDAALEYISWLLACETLVTTRQDSPGQGEHLPVDITVIVGLDFPNLFRDHDRKWWLVP